MLPYSGQPGPLTVGSPHNTEEPNCERNSCSTFPALPRACACASVCVCASLWLHTIKTVQRRRNRLSESPCAQTGATALPVGSRGACRQSGLPLKKPRDSSASSLSQGPLQRPRPAKSIQRGKPPLLVLWIWAKPLSRAPPPTAALAAGALRMWDDNYDRAQRAPVSVFALFLLETAGHTPTPQTHAHRAAVTFTTKQTAAPAVGAIDPTPAIDIRR